MPEGLITIDCDLVYISPIFILAQTNCADILGFNGDLQNPKLMSFIGMCYGVRYFVLARFNGILLIPILDHIFSEW